MVDAGPSSEPIEDADADNRVARAVGELLEELENSARYWRGRRSWHRKYYEFLSPVLGVPAASLAAAAGVSALQNVSRTLVAVLAAASSVLIAIQTFVNPQARARANRAQEARFAAIEMEAAFIRRVRLVSPEPFDAPAAVTRLQREFADAMAQAPTAGDG